LISFFASSWGSFGSGSLSEWVQAFFLHPTLFSFSLAAFFPCFRRFRHAFSFLPAVFCLSPLTHSSLFTFVTAEVFPRQLAIAAKPGIQLAVLNVPIKKLQGFKSGDLGGPSESCLIAK
jgi:hypothetical protein